MRQAIGLGAGGHAKVLIDILQLRNEFKIVGLLDPAPLSNVVAGIAILGNDEELPKLHRAGITAAFVGVGGVGDNTLRIQLYGRAGAAGFDMINIVHPSAVIARSVVLGKGVAIMASVVVNPEAHLADNVIVNTGAIVEHDCRIETHAHISPGAILAGGVHIGEGAYIGAGATIRQGIHVGEYSIVGAGAVVVKDVPRRTLVVGVPAKPVRSL